MFAKTALLGAAGDRGFARCGAFAAYAIARLNLKRRQLILTAIIASSMSPDHAAGADLRDHGRWAGLNSYLALVFPMSC